MNKLEHFERTESGRRQNWRPLMFTGGFVGSRAELFLERRGCVAGPKEQRRIALDKKIAGFLGAVAALGTVSSTQAAPLAPPTEVLQVNSYADLLEPIPNAGAILKAVDQQTEAVGGEAKILTVQYHHHHHHHHRTVIIKHRRHHHHHHHHHHN